MVTVMAATFRIAATTQVDQSCWSRGTSVDLCLIHSSFGPRESALSRTAYRSVHPFLWGFLVCQTDKQTHADRPRNVRQL